ncbi:hypothetical protein [Methanothermobacter thermautotrophicus]|uniref:hypothetical protein n=1 Tax=Methanothermobacter thermautotrophicus TaxID=145262 RepID=UPI001EE15FE1|nr:hypothetical protein [Methanothermobacter thermautotrophicus]
MKINDDASIVLCGEAGQGIQTVEALLIRPSRPPATTYSPARSTCPVCVEGRTPH